MSERKITTAESAPIAESVLSGVLVERPKKDASVRKQEQTEALAGIRERIFCKSMAGVEDYLRARDIDPKKEIPTDDPEFWKMTEELGSPEAATKAYRLALSGWLPGADCPGFVKVASNMAIGIMKANAAEKGGSRVLNVGLIHIDAAAIPQFEEVDVE